MCDRKHRHLNKNSPEAKIAFYAFQKFFIHNYPMTPQKTHTEFIESPYYSVFYRFGAYCRETMVFDYTKYLNHLIKYNIKVDKWASDEIYEAWLLYYLPIEPPAAALERGMTIMVDWAKTSNYEFYEYFNQAGVSLITHRIITGRLSPWIIFNCDSGVNFLMNLDPAAEKILMRWINPEVWGNVLKNKKSDTEWCREVLSQAGF